MASYNFGKDDVVNYIHEKFPNGGTCLDVGPCDGKWHNLLGDLMTMDACEIFKPNIENHQLEDRYRKVFNKDIFDLEYEWYDLILMCDVIEHMTVERAQKVLEYAKPRCKELIVAVPYLYSQDAIYGNPWEVHIQNDLTKEIFDQRYPGFRTLVRPVWEYAYYVKDNL